MRNSNFFAATLLVCAACVSCSSDFEVQEENLLNFQDVLQGETITLPSIEKTLGTCDESTCLYTSSNGSIKLHGNSFAVGDTLYYPIDVQEDLVVKRCVKKENNGRTVTSSLWSYFCSYKDSLEETVHQVVSFAPDARFLRNNRMEREKCLTKLPFLSDFSGVILVSKLDGTIENGAIYYSGKKTQEIVPEKASRSVKSKILQNESNNVILVFIQRNLDETRGSSYTAYDHDSEDFTDFCMYCGETEANCWCQRCPTCEEKMGDCTCSPDSCTVCNSKPCLCGKCEKCGEEKSNCTCNEESTIGRESQFCTCNP